MKAPKAEISFQLYIAAEDNVIGTVLKQETDQNTVMNNLSQQASDF
jgi:hypothetical protein